MSLEHTLREITGAMTNLDPEIRFCLAEMLRIRADREDWPCRKRQHGKGYVTVLLPEDIRLILSLNSSKHPKGEIGRTRVAKALLACAYRMHIKRIRHGYKGAAKSRFIGRYNLGNCGLLPDVYQQIGKANRNTVEGWVSKLQQNDWNPMCLSDSRRSSKQGKE